ncbi:MAG: phosphate acyltransferase [Succinivibrionaceae bacterium]|nr:phosphate acyltransferase [Succinivibrionaceae bacterium]
MDRASCTVAVDATGGDDHSPQSVVGAVRFALSLNPSLRLIVYGPPSFRDEVISAAARVPGGSTRKGALRLEFREAPESIPQDESPRAVLEGYPRAAMRLAIESVRAGEAQAVVSAGGTGPLVTLSRHILGTIGRLRPALAARMPSGPGRFALMLDLGANASCGAADLHDFARLGQAAARVALGIASPRVALLNVGTEQGKGNRLIHEARDLMRADAALSFQGYLEANRIFRGDADVIVTDGFTGNVALKAAEGVAGIFGAQGGIKRFFARLSRPEWLLPWQYNGSWLLGVRGVVVKSHGSAGVEALAVAMTEAARGAAGDLATAMERELA